MKHKSWVPAMAAALLVACTGEDATNEAAQANNLIEPIENAVLNEVANTAEAQENVPADEAAPPRREPPATKAPPARPPRPPQPRPEPEPDPHAGHNMANMQH